MIKASVPNTTPNKTFMSLRLTTQHENVYTLKGISSKYVMISGSNWLIYSGSDVVELSGSTVATIGYGKAKVAAYKGNGTLLGFYYFTVIR